MVCSLYPYSTDKTGVVHVHMIVWLYFAGVVVQFDAETYSVMEGSSASITVVVIGRSAIPFFVLFRTQDDTALGKYHGNSMDYL